MQTHVLMLYNKMDLWDLQAMTSKPTKDKTTDLEMQSALLPWNDPYQNNCSLNMHEYQRILVERNNELAQHVIIIRMFDK